ncbi:MULTISPECIES: antirestriction protein [unclassified Polaromonas]|uniref:antirestriction protein n=1 Tax=unclassified Polaromonas TaxID=2638319 RepID=UPI000F077F07|nr:MULTISPECIES: antirestriction protein [unclassified Polaromonas]AYQ26907.1 antirestriction protein [Polaromonas sp. SP1]QGJ18246.1 antirestriction protein [Polaromonas sp. Pch-P]
MTSPASIFSERLDDRRRLDVPAKLFGIRFPMYVESFVFDTAGSLSEQYNGGLWHFNLLSNGGFYMAPDQAEPFHVICDNGFEGDLSADAFGITVCLYAYSMLSFSGNEEFAQTCAQQYHWLREYMAEHAEMTVILKATD